MHDSLQMKFPVRIVTASSLFDGHDAAINLMRRIMQSSGAEIIHLGHNRSAEEIVHAAIQEDAQGIAITSYQGGHIEFFTYVLSLLKKYKRTDIRVFGGGGGTILPSEAQFLETAGIAKIYMPEDGRNMGLQGMINNLLSQCDFDLCLEKYTSLPQASNALLVAKWLSLAENKPELFKIKWNELQPNVPTIPVLGITGTGGAGKSTLTDEMLRRFRLAFPQMPIAILSVDPSRKKSGGALLGDRIRMNAVHSDLVFMRSMATRTSSGSLSAAVHDALTILKTAGFQLIILESSGIGQSDTEITSYADHSVYVMTPEYGAASQLEKIDMLDFADTIVLNKADKAGARDALRDVRKQYRRNKNEWALQDEVLPIFSTEASAFNDHGTHRCFEYLCACLQLKSNLVQPLAPEHALIPPDRRYYLGEIVQWHKTYQKYVREQSEWATKAYQVNGSIEMLKNQAIEVPEALQTLQQEIETQLDSDTQKVIHNWKYLVAKYKSPTYKYQVRNKLIERPLYKKSLSGLDIPKIALPEFKDWGDIVRWRYEENVPGKFPFTSGVFPLKREEEDPTRMFAGEGIAERTNKRFHYLSEGLKAKRLSTAFDSVTLYGHNPAERPDIFGKIGNSGVSVACLDDAKRLYAGFDLCDPNTSVSMTINGPAPFILAYFLHTAIDQQCEIYLRKEGKMDLLEKAISNRYTQKNRPVYRAEMPKNSSGLGLAMLGISGKEILEPEVYEKIKQYSLQQVRGTVQADVLKEDQAQNTCIFSVPFSLTLMGDVQAYFIEQQIQNFYSVSISGYHIAEAGANPISQLAFTLANGFTYVEYYLSRGMDVNDFAPNFSFFFSNGLDPEYTVMGRVARRIWAKAMRFKYKANERAQKLKYHIQTSGRSLHAQEVDFNDIRTTLQALYALYDNCNSLHTNAFDEAITTPTESSVRRAMAIQLIINKELGLSKNENPLQGSFIVEELTNLVEEAVMQEFLNISERGGVLGAMERMYQRSKIQDESMWYEQQKHDGSLPIIGVNTFLSSNAKENQELGEVVRSSDAEKKQSIEDINRFKEQHQGAREQAQSALFEASAKHENLFKTIVDVAPVMSLEDFTETFNTIGGQYRRNV